MPWDKKFNFKTVDRKTEVDWQLVITIAGRAHSPFNMVTNRVIFSPGPSLGQNYDKLMTNLEDYKVLGDREEFIQICSRNIEAIRVNESFETLDLGREGVGRLARPCLRSEVDYVDRECVCFLNAWLKVRSFVSVETSPVSGPVLVIAFSPVFFSIQGCNTWVAQ